MLRRSTLFNFAAVTPFLLAPKVIKMPALSPTMETGNLVSWEMKVGEKIEENSLLAKVQTDKATNDFTYVGDEMSLARLIAEVGSTVEVGQPVALAVEDKEELDSDEVKNWKPQSSNKKIPVDKKETFDAPTPAASAGGKTATSSSSSSGNRIFASPAARRTAEELGVSLSSIKGTGGGVGRITRDDVLNQAEEASSSASASSSSSQQQQKSAAGIPSAPVSSNYEDIAISPMRQIIAQRLHQSKNLEVPHYYLMNDYRADPMLKLLKHLNSKADGAYKISVNDYIVKCVARANMIVPECNTHWIGAEKVMRRYNNVDVSVAVATPTGLITPIIKNANLKGLSQISQETKELAKRAREGTLKPDEYQGGTVSVSNLGAMGVDRFTAIINPPQSMILAIGQSRPRPEIKKNEDGTFTSTGVIESVVSFSASFDHRVVDGAIGAKWFQHFGEAFENPLTLML